MSLLKQNEKEANLLVAKVMRNTFIFLTIVYLLNVVGIFVIDKVIMTIAYIGGSVLLFIPTILANVLKSESRMVKYVNVVCAAVFITLMAVTLTYHTVVLYVYPIAIASLYFSKRLNIVATTLTVFGVSVGQVAAFYLDTIQDDNFTEFYKTIVFGIIPRALALIAIAAIFTMLCSRTASMLSNLMGAEQQKLMQEKTAHTSKVLFGMVTELSDITKVSLQTNQQIAGETELLLARTTENTSAVENTDTRIQEIAQQINGLSNMNHNTAKLTEQISENTKENQKRMDDATMSMEQVHSSTEECKKIMANFEKESKKIIGIIKTITDISDQTNILALNASIEAARAGEHGKSFAVVAGEIQKLSVQTKTAVEGIAGIVTEVVDNTETAVKVMEENALYTQKGMDSIQKANVSSGEITASNKELLEQILEIDKITEIIREKSSEAAQNMDQISDNTQQNCDAVGQVSAATQESNAATASLAGIVEQIKELSEQLNKVVQ